MKTKIRSHRLTANPVKNVASVHTNPQLMRISARRGFFWMYAAIGSAPTVVIS